MLLECWSARITSNQIRMYFRAWHESAAFPMRQGLEGLGPKDGSGSAPRSGLTVKPCRPSAEGMLEIRCRFMFVPGTELTAFQLSGRPLY